MIAALIFALAAQGDGNRLWWLELELAGPCAEFTLDCGADGTTRVRGPFLPGEGRSLRVPVPVRAPLGSEGLALVPLPTASSVEARVVGWSATQPDQDLVRRARGLLARGRPPAGAAPARAGRPEVLLVAFLLPVLLFLRRRRLAFALVALAGGAFVFVRTRARPSAAVAVELHDLDLTAAQALGVRAARDELELPRTRLEARPDGVRLAFEFTLDGSPGWVRARAATLLALEPLEPMEPLSARSFVAPALASAWVRTPAGEWTAHGPWPAGRPLPAALATADAPPGWLVGALPPGTGLLVGQTRDGAWLRASGFELPGAESEEGY